MLNNIGLPGLLFVGMLLGTGFNPVPLVVFSAFAAGTFALGMN